LKGIAIGFLLQDSDEKSKGGGLGKETPRGEQMQGGFKRTWQKGEKKRQGRGKGPKIEARCLGVLQLGENQK